jgi:hypothetical protein
MCNRNDVCITKQVGEENITEEAFLDELEQQIHLHAQAAEAEARRIAQAVNPIATMLNTTFANNQIINMC